MTLASSMAVVSAGVALDLFVVFSLAVGSEEMKPELSKYKKAALKTKRAVQTPNTTVS